MRFCWGIFCLYVSVHLLADWNPGECLLEVETTENIKEKGFVALKNRVFKALEGSWCSKEEAELIMDLVLLTKPKVVVEVGTFTGAFFLPTIATLNYLNHGVAFAVDAWSNKYATQGVNPTDLNYQWWGNVDMRQAKRECMNLISAWDRQSRAKIIHKLPREAAKEIKSLDFLHLLGGLSEEQVLEQVEQYLPKVKTGGYVLLSNAFLTISGRLTKMQALWSLLDSCDLVSELDHTNIVLLRKTGNEPISKEMPVFYQKHLDEPTTLQEQHIVDHVRLSYERAIKFESKLKGIQFRDTSEPLDPKKPRDYRFLKELSHRPYYHLINNLCELKQATHLHLGLLAGDSFIAALYENQKVMGRQIGLDWFEECPREIFDANCKKHIALEECVIIDGPCFSVDKGSFQSPVDIFLYDADHSMIAHRKAFTYYNDVFAPIFVAVIDDWECPWIRRATFKAFEDLNYQVLYQAYIPGPYSYRSGQYVVVLRKSGI